MTMSRFSNTTPTYIDVPVIDMETGMFTAQWKQIMQQLMGALQTSMGNQGMVMPSQTAADIALIQNAKNYNPNTTTPNSFICQFGTIIYDSTNNVLVVALNDGTGAPQFHNIVTI